MRRKRHSGRESHLHAPQRAPEEAQARKVTRVQILAKAAVQAGDAVDEATALDLIESNEADWRENNAIEAPYDPHTLLSLVELSPHITPNLDAYAVNIDGHGHHFEPIAPWMKNLDSEDTVDEVREALEYEAWFDEQEAAIEAERDGDGQGEPDAPIEIDDEEVLAKVEALRGQLRRERFVADAWFANCCSETSFERLRRDMRWDYEAIGWTCLELIEDGYGRLVRIAYVPPQTVRPVADMGEAVEVIEPNPVTPLSEGRELRVMRRLWRYVQRVNGKMVYFKHPSDPRTISRYTGKIYADEKEMLRKEEHAEPANALLWMAHHNPRTPCSPPRWVGNLLRVIGTREADETNYYHLRNKTMAGGILFVNGGKLGRGVKDRLERAIANELQGSENTSRILVVEAVPTGKTAPGERQVLPEMSFQNLRDPSAGEGMFAAYDERASDSIGASFRQSPMLRGYTPSDLNRATAEASIRFAEDQVYQPEREDFDWLINKYLMPRIGVRLLRFVSNTPPTRSVEEVGEFVKNVAPHGGLLPSEIRSLSAKALNTELEPVEGDWAGHPMVLTLAGIGPSAEGTEVNATDQRLRRLEAKLSSVVSDELRAAGLDAHVRAAMVDATDDTRAALDDFDEEDQ